MMVRDYLDAGIYKGQILIINKPIFKLRDHRYFVKTYNKLELTSNIKNINNSKFGIAVYEQENNCYFKFAILTEKGFNNTTVEWEYNFEEFYNKEINDL
ncbi:MAG: hypothetical protein ABIP51_16290 [Bacteroidia bacterium]